ncbi:hypothetical protein L0244_34725, partial [bacterium]|nr:hypothetical protein [bacterium]
NRNNENRRSFLPLMKGEIKEGVGVFKMFPTSPLPLLHKEGNLVDRRFSKQYAEIAEFKKLFFCVLCDLCGNI